MFNVGWNPPEWTSNERKLFEEIRGGEWMLASTILKSFPEWGIHTVNNTLRRLLIRGVVEKKEDKTLKRMFWRVKDGSE